jgi:hypothetical protein
VHSAFVKYKDQVHKEDGFVLLDESANRVYVAQTGLIGSGSLPHAQDADDAGSGRTLAERWPERT